MNNEVLDIAKKFVSTHFPECEIALLSGSVVRGEETPSSDLDIIIIDSVSFRKSYLFFDWPIEAFVHNKESLDYTFFIEKHHGIPIVTRMCAEGVIIKGDEAANDLIKKGKENLLDGPSELSQKKLDEARYTISDLIIDFEGSEVEEEDIYTVTALTDCLHRFILRANQMWTGEGKWMYRSLRKYDEAIAERFTQCINNFYKTNQKDELIQFVDEILHPYGGRLFHEYTQSTI